MSKSKKKFRFSYPEEMGAFLDLPSSKVKILDKYTKRITPEYVDELSTYLLKLANEPDWALFRVREHVRRKAPKLETKHKKIERSHSRIDLKLDLAGYAITNSKSLQGTEKHIKSIQESLQKLKNVPNFFPKETPNEMEVIIEDKDEQEPEEVVQESVGKEVKNIDGKSFEFLHAKLAPENKKVTNDEPKETPSNEEKEETNNISSPEPSEVSEEEISSSEEPENKEKSEDSNISSEKEKEEEKKSSEEEVSENSTPSPALVVTPEEPDKKTETNTDEVSN